MHNVCAYVCVRVGKTRLSCSFRSASATCDVIAGSTMITTPSINDSCRGRRNISFNGALETPQGAPRGQVGITSRDNGGVFSPFDHLVKFLPREGEGDAGRACRTECLATFCLIQTRNETRRNSPIPLCATSSSAPTFCFATKHHAIIKRHCLEEYLFFFFSPPLFHVPFCAIVKKKRSTTKKLVTLNLS